MGMREIKVTLKTSSLEEARRRSNIIESHILSILAHVGSDDRVEDISPDQIRRMVTEWLKQKIDEMENMRSLDYMDPVFSIDQTGRIRSQTPEERKNLLLAEAELERNILTGEIKGKTSIETAAEIMIQKTGINADGNSLPYLRLCREMRKAYLAYAQKELQHFEGDYDDYKDAQIFLPAVDAHEPLEVGYQEGKSTKQSLKDLLGTYLKYKESENIKAKSLLEIKNKCELFVEILDNPKVEEVNIESLTRYKNALKKLPANARKKHKYRNKSIKQLLQMNILDKDVVDTTTVNNHLVKAKSFLIWLETFGYLLGKNLPSALQKIKESHRSFEERDIFTVPELQKIFSHPDYLQFVHPWEFWLPLIALFSGMRIGEICRLRIQDIKKEAGIIFFDVTVTESDQPKTQAGVRKIPLHDELVNLGLFDYVRTLGRSGCRFLFPDRQGLDVSPSHYPVQRINKWFKKIGVAESGKKLGRKSFHSFRHTFETRCQGLGLEQRLVDQIMGHSVGKSMSGRYGKPAPIEQLKREVIDKYCFEKLDLSHLSNSKYSK